MKYSGLLANHQKSKYDKPHVKAFAIICFWRPVDMKEPVRNKPLAVLDKQSVKPADIVPSMLYDLVPKGPVNQFALKYNEAHKWYYYPEMRTDEVLAFTQFYYVKGEDEVEPG